MAAIGGAPAAPFVMPVDANGAPDYGPVIAGGLGAWRAAHQDARIANLSGRHLIHADFVALDGLAAVDISGCDGADITSAAFAHLRGICVLRASNCPWLTDAALTALTSLQSLDVSGCDGVTGVALAHLPALRRLVAARCAGLKDVGLAALSRSPVEYLDVSGCARVTDAGFAGLTAVQTLVVRRCPRVTGVGFAGLSRLRVLDASGCPRLTDAALAGLSGWVEDLDVSDTLIGQTGVFGALRACQRLCISGCNLSDAGLESLAASGLRGVEIGTVGRTAATVAAYLRRKRDAHSMIVLEVRLPSKTIMLAVNPFDFIDMVKILIRDKEGIPPHKQQLDHNGRTLDDKHSLEYYGITDECTIDLSTG
jgi:hypothetical protein